MMMTARTKPETIVPVMDLSGFIFSLLLEKKYLIFSAG